MRTGIVAAAAFVACTFAQPGLAADAAPPVDTPLASKIRYTLPRTSVDIVVTLALKKCSPHPVIEPSVTVTPEASPEAHAQYRFELDAAYLQSFSRDKNLDIETNPNGTLKSLNGGATDQTAGIVTSIIKTIASIAMLAAPAGEDPVAKSTCNKDTMEVLRRVDVYAASIKAFQTDLESKDPEKIACAKAAIDALAAQEAQLQTTTLQIMLPKIEYVLDRGWSADHILVTRDQLSKWLNPTGQPTDTPKDLKLAFCAFTAEEAERANGKPQCSTEEVDNRIMALRDGSRQNPLPKELVAEAPNCDGGMTCPRTIVLREPVNAIFIVAVEGAGYTKPPSTVLAQQNIKVSQWGLLSYIPIKAGFGKSVTFQMSFDDYGHKLGESWSYKARGAGIFSGVSSAVDAGSSFANSLAGANLAADKAELDKLTTEKNLNQIKVCKAVIDAGGFNCPTQ
jgi:hypothetical protein